MSGKGVLIMVMGFSLIFLFMGRYWDELTTRAVDNHVEYYKETIAHNIAVSGANIALHHVSDDPDWTAGITNRPFEKGIMNVVVTVPDTISKLITSKGTFMGTERIVKVRFGKASFAKYAWFTGNVSSSKIFITGDTVWGGMHSNQTLNIGGDPVFFGKVTTSKGMKPSESQMIKSGFHPKFLGGYGTGINVDFPSSYDFESQRYAALNGGKYYEDAGAPDLWLTFNADGTITYRQGKGNDPSKYSAPVTESLTTFSSNGMIYVSKGDIYVSGTLKGKATIVADQSSGMGGGNVYFVNDLVYSVSPMIRVANGDYVANPACNDLMGIMASNSAIIATTAISTGQLNNVTNKDVRIDGGIFGAQGGLKVENLNTTPYSGIFYLQGSMVAGTEENMAMMDKNGNITNGYTKHVVYDERFHTGAPLYFVLSNNYEVVSWLE